MVGKLDNVALTAVAARLALAGRVAVGATERIELKDGFRNRDHVVFNGHHSVVMRAKAGSADPIVVDVRPLDIGIAPAKGTF